MPLEGWHTVLRVELVAPDERDGADAAHFGEATLAAERVALESALAAGGTWHRASSGGAILLIRTDEQEPGDEAAAVEVAAEKLVRRLRRRVPDLDVVVGIGASHAGVIGLRTSAAEARAACASARSRGSSKAVVRFDAVGLQRAIVEWYASDSAREAVNAILRPLDRLGQRRSRDMLHTLQCYLDYGGSLRQAAEELHLHRNTVSYRIKRTLDLLGLDTADPDQRLLLELACRARSLG